MHLHRQLVAIVLSMLPSTAPILPLQPPHDI
jgi:hypothetical protein